MPPPTSLSMHPKIPIRSPYLVLLLVLSTFSGLASSEPPEIHPNREELTLDVGQSFNLTCRAAKPVAWCSDADFTTEDYEEIYEEGEAKPYTSILTIKKVNTGHVGYFSCVYNTTENKEKANCDTNDPLISSIYLFVKDPHNLMVATTLFYITGRVGESVLLPCKPTFPEVKVTVFKDDTIPTAEYDPRSGFVIRGPTVQRNEGHYRCTATYKNKTEENFPIFLNIEARDVPLKPPVLAVNGVWQENMHSGNDTVVYYVEEGSNVNLTCTSNEKTLPQSYKLRWNKKSHLNDSETVHRIIRQNKRLPDGQVVRYYEIQGVRPKESGIYTCSSFVHEESMNSAHLNLTVIAKDASYITQTIDTTTVTELDEPVEWEITVMAYPEPTFKWKKDGEVKRDHPPKHAGDHSARYEIHWERKYGSLILSLAQPNLTDNGEYILEATLPDKTVSRTTMYLFIPGPPQNVKIERRSDKELYKEKEMFSVQCSAEGFPKPDIQLLFRPYKKENTSYQNATGGPHVYNQLHEATGMNEEATNVIVERIVRWTGKAEQPGWYQCKAANEHGEVASQEQGFLMTDGGYRSTFSVELLINGMQWGFGNAREPVTVVEGDNVTVICRANKMSAKSPPTWILDGSYLTNQTEDLWGMKVLEKETRYSLLSTVRASSIKKSASSFTLTCSETGGEESSGTILVQEMEKPKWKASEPPKENYEKKKNGNLTLSCLVEGNPFPDIDWKKDGKPLTKSDRYVLKNKSQQLYIPTLIPDYAGRYTCEVTNRAGKLSHSFDIKVLDPDGQRTVIILVVVGILIFALVVLSVFFCRKIYQARKETLNLQLMEQKLFNDGDPSSLNPEISLEQQAELLPYNTKYEVSRDSIIFDKLLGAGAFGRVYRATALNLLPGEARTTVAVKMMKSRTDCAQLKALRSEVKIMIHIGRHINIVNLLGACSKDLASKGELLLLVEYCKYGNILDYMRRHRREFVNQINDEDKIDPAYCPEPRPRHRSDSSSRSRGSRGLKYAHLNFHQDNVFYGHDQTSDGAAETPNSLFPPSRLNGEAGASADSGGQPFRARTLSASSGSQHIASDNSFLLPSETSGGTSDGYLSAHSLSGAQAALCSMDILGWAYQIAKGMEYLAFKKVLHGDLAARNVLLAENNVVKISDFGLAKDIYKNENYKKKSSGPVPVKWMAVECLRDGVFSTQSDVWSFGVVLWEIFSLGQVPYSCAEFDQSFIDKLEKGVRLEQPRYATYGLYRVMLECWNNDPMERPSFTGLEASLGEMLGEAQRQNYIQLTEPYQDDNASNEFLDLLPSQDYSNKVREASQPLTEDGYEMPFSPGVAPQLMTCDDRQSTASRLTSRQMEYLQTVAKEDSDSSYLPMSADRTDGRPVFDFDNKTVACMMGRREEQESSGDDPYLRMDKITPSHSPVPDTPNEPTLKGREESPRRLVLKSVSSPSSQGGGRHQALTKHDSGVYSPTVLSQTNPGYMTMTLPLSADDQNKCINNNMETFEADSREYANFKPMKPRDYLADAKDTTEYANLLPQDAVRSRTLSESSSGVGSIEESPPRQRGGKDPLTPPILEEAMVV